ncbi:hypothetical protein [Alkalicoccobacillus murimartini]|uniref:Uncharacterized protein n=1 Tax=Alkalicoccobacillus murimartini TaxID=171685 RepID=A0ABT9YE59_9BACI|nr:hypothetical protein [Alkalicoccobacillus murimartini]MDQ0206134.1 hypothetical protein [Alkalicoccobacillus murimartini]
MKKGLLVIGIVVCCLIGAAVLRSLVVESKELNRDMSYEQIDEVYLDSEVGDLDPSNIKVIPEGTKQFKNLFTYYDVTFALNETNKIIYVSTVDSDSKTSEGISVGADKSDIIIKYGRNYYGKTTDTGETYISYQDRHAEIRFWLDQEERLYLIELIRV